MNRRDFLRVGSTAALAGVARRASAQPAQRPNILFCISDDQSWAHTGASGDRVVQTPTFDRIAREGVLFTHAFCAAPSCTPSRGSILTGQMFWRLAEGGNLWSTLPSRFPVYPDLLEAAGYHVGLMGKGWGPGDFKPGGRTRNPAGPGYRSFDEFLKTVPADRPFCFWYGSNDPHRPYEKGSGLASGKRIEDVQVPPFLPDDPEVRSDILDYYFEIERFDRQVGQMVALLEAAGRLDDTIVVITSDNGMPFPRSKANLYEYGTRLPLAVRWPREVKSGRAIHDFVSFTDYAPTLLEAAGLNPPPEMTGRSFLDLLTGTKSGRVDPKRSRVFTGRERHAWCREGGLGYPCRALRTRRYLYIRNFRPERWPAGDPEGYGDIDGSPSKSFMMAHRDDPKVAPLFALAFAKRPAEELYDLEKDPSEFVNVADRPGYADTRRKLAAELQEYLTATNDPRARGEGDFWDETEYYGQRPT
jgi:uncharacterized sulfatase